jgi:hypothetical protein
VACPPRRHSEQHRNFAILDAIPNQHAPVRPEQLEARLEVVCAPPAKDVRRIPGNPKGADVSGPARREGANPVRTAAAVLNNHVIDVEWQINTYLTAKPNIVNVGAAIRYTQRARAYVVASVGNSHIRYLAWAIPPTSSITLHESETIGDVA